MIPTLLIIGLFFACLAFSDTLLHGIDTTKEVKKKTPVKRVGIVLKDKKKLKYALIDTHNMKNAWREETSGELLKCDEKDRFIIREDETNLILSGERNNFFIREI
jgi:hypothetical protein